MSTFRRHRELHFLICDGCSQCYLWLTMKLKLGLDYHPLSLIVMGLFVCVCPSQNRRVFSWNRDVLIHIKKILKK